MALGAAGDGMIDGDRGQNTVGYCFPGGVCGHKRDPQSRLAQAHGGGKEVAAIGRMKLPSGGFKHGVHMALQAKAVGERDQAILRKLIDGDGGQGSDGMLWRDHGAAISASPLAISLSISCMLPTIISTNTLGQD